LDSITTMRPQVVTLIPVSRSLASVSAAALIVAMGVLSSCVTADTKSDRIVVNCVFVFTARAVMINPTAKSRLDIAAKARTRLAATESRNKSVLSAPLTTTLHFSGTKFLATGNAD
jgi:hypothetical protein